MNSTIINRVNQLQTSHPWMLEREATGLLVAVWVAVNHLNRDSNKIQQEMDDATNKMCQDTRKNLEQLISNLPAKFTEG